MRFRWTLIVALLTLAVVPAASARTWTSADGGYTVEADLVAFKLGWVKLLKTSGAEITVPLVKLSAADQQFVREYLQAKLGATGESTTTSPTEEKPAAGGDVLAGLKINGNVEWDDMIRMDNDGKQLPPALVVSVVLTGKAAAEGSAYGFVKVESAVDGDGKAMKMMEDGFGFNDPTEEFVKVDRSSFFAKHPDDGLCLPLQFEHPTKPLKKVGSVKGSLKLRTGGTRKTIVVEDVGSAKQKSITDPVVTTAGIRQLEVTAGDDNVEIKVQGSDEAIEKIALVDAAGKKLSNGDSRTAFGDQIQSNLYFDEKLPTDARLEITLVTGAHEVDVPFRIENLEVPPVSK